MPNLIHMRDRYCKTESSTSVLTALTTCAKRLDITDAPPREMALALDRYLAKNTTAASIARADGAMTADWAEAVVDSVTNVKRRRDDAPRDGSSGGSGQVSGSIGNIGVSRGMFQALEDVQATPEYIRQRRSLVKLFMSMGTTAAADRTALLEQTLTGKTPAELLPPIGAERDTVIADESNAKPIPLFHQMVSASATTRRRSTPSFISYRRSQTWSYSARSWGAWRRAPIGIGQSLCPRAWPTYN